MDSLGSGLVAFLMTDVVGSTAAWEADASGMSASIAHHDEIVQEISARYGGTLIKARGEGDSHFLVFQNAGDAVACALGITQSLIGTKWPGPSLQVRAAVHLGEAVTRGGDYYGPTVNRCARVRALASAGQVLISDAVYRVLQEAVKENWRFSDLGTHRLKDLLRPERLWHVQDANQPVEFAPIRSFSSTPNNLPIQLTEFIGRKGDVQEAQNLVRRHRLVTLLGAGGSGKTRLAMQVAAEMADDFADGVWWVDLASVPSDEAPIIPVILRELGIRPTGDVPEDIVLERWLDGRHCLLVLDNCEQVARSTSVLSTWLTAASNSIHLLCTSRHTLNAKGEQLYTVPTLSYPERGERLTAVSCMAFEAVELLVERARLRDVRFSPTDENAEQLAEICRRLDGLPLAIELAAPKLTFLGPSAMVKRLDDVFRLLHGSSSGSLHRHETIETAIEWSYGLLTQAEQTLFRRLSVYVSPWTTEQAEEMLGYPIVERDSVIEHLMSLRDKSLITPVARELHDRHALLEPIRQFAERKQTSEEKQKVASELVKWYARRSEMAESLPPSDLAKWVESLGDEYENAARALNYAIDASASTEAFWLALGLHRYWLHRSLYEEAGRRLEQVLALPPPSDQRLLARILNIRGVVAWFVLDCDKAETFIQRALAIYREIGEEGRAAGAVVNLGLIATRRQDASLARGFFREAIRLAESCERHEMVGSSLLNLASLERDEENFEVAATLYLRALEDAGSTLSDWMRTTLMGNLASCYVMLGQSDAAKPLIARALENSLRGSYWDRIDAMLTLVAQMAIDLGRSDLATTFLDAAGDLRQEYDVETAGGFEPNLRSKLEAELVKNGSAERTYRGPIQQALEGIVRDAMGWLASAETQGVLGTRQLGEHR